MTATLMDGKSVAAKILDRARQRVDHIKSTTGVSPCLATVLVGADPASITYTQMKRRRCEAIGMLSRKVELPAETTTATLLAEIRRLGADPAVHGILLQHPSPPHIDERAAFEAIPLHKDVDGVTHGSFAHMWLPPPEVAPPPPGVGPPSPEVAAANPKAPSGSEAEISGGELPGGFASCTPGGIVRLLDAYDVELEGKHAVVIGRSAILGKPMAGLLLARHATVTLCHSRTRNLPDLVKQADLVVAALGKAEFVKGSWIKEGAVVMDAGYNAGNVGDVEFAPAAERASMITPVPGGVGPMTIATLIDQTVDAAASQLGVSRATKTRRHKGIKTIDLNRLQRDSAQLFRRIYSKATTFRNEFICRSSCLRAFVADPP